MQTNRLSSPLMDAGRKAMTYDAVVVGSGYGGAIAASRLTRAGRSVCVLERGREIPPGQYPSTLSEAYPEVQMTTRHGPLGRLDGMFRFHVNPDISVLVGCGLGGTSLINANVLLEIDPQRFREPEWPAQFRNDPTLLEQYYLRAKDMLGARRYPEAARPLNKLSGLREAADRIHRGDNFVRPELSVNFEPQINRFGVRQNACVACGDCVTGCNHSAKNTTLMNYLPDARNNGADIYTLATVEYVKRDGAVWQVHVLPTIPGEDGHAKEVLITAELVVLAAGTLGSTEILLRSRQRGLTVSGRLGERFSGNGDALAFGYNSYWRRSPHGQGQASIHGIGAGQNSLESSKLPGPCIAGTLDFRNTKKASEAIVIQEGVVPGALSSILPPMYFFAATLFANFFRYGFKEAETRLRETGELGQAILRAEGDLSSLCYRGPISRTQSYLMMGLDESCGRIRLTGNGQTVRIDWPNAGMDEPISNANEKVRALNEAIRGQFVPNMLWSPEFGHRLVSVHPVGGCCMGDDARTGVVNDECEVFSGPTGRETHDGLYVCDGAVLPGAVGVNPLLTICAVTERALDLLIQRRGWQSDRTLGERRVLVAPTLRRGGGALFHVVKTVSSTVLARMTRALRKLLGRIIETWPDQFRVTFEFAETMEGFVSAAASPSHSGDRSTENDYEVAYAIGRAMNQSMSFELTIATDNVHGLVKARSHPADIVRGTVTCPALSAKGPMRVKPAANAIHLLETDSDGVEHWMMTYTMVLETSESETFLFQGTKHLRRGRGLGWWRDLTTLFVEIRRGNSKRSPLHMTGILKLDLDDFIRQVQTARSNIDPKGPIGGFLCRSRRLRDAARMLVLLKLARLFGETLFRAYGDLLTDLNDFFKTDSERRDRRPLHAPQPQRFTIPAKNDKARLQLTRYRKGQGMPIVLAPGFSVNASSFAMDTVKKNFVEFLAERDQDVWLFDYRASPDSGSSTTQFSIDDIARNDWPAAVEFILDTTGESQVQVVAHCVGSMTLLMALLDGAVDRAQLCSVICSQLTLHPVTNWLNYAKADIKLARLFDNIGDLGASFGISVDSAGAGPGINIQSTGSTRDQALDAVLYQVPVPDGEQCNNPVCHRIFSVYGPSYTHAQLNHGTHVAMRELFGGISIEPLKQLALILKTGYVVDKDGRNTYMRPEHVSRLDLPITFITGDRNQLFFPQTSLRTYEWLCAHNPDRARAGHYEWHSFSEYAHLDCFIGKNAASDVYPYLWRQLTKHRA